MGKDSFFFLVGVKGKRNLKGGRMILSETHILAPENGCLEDDSFLLGVCLFLGAHISFREGKNQPTKRIAENTTKCKLQVIIFVR